MAKTEPHHRFVTALLDAMVPLAGGAEMEHDTLVQRLDAFAKLADEQRRDVAAQLLVLIPRFERAGATRTSQQLAIFVVAAMGAAAATVALASPAPRSLGISTPSGATTRSRSARASRPPNPPGASADRLTMS